MTRETKNAVIRSVRLGGYDGFGSMLTAYVDLEYGGSGQSFGGYALGGPFTHVFIMGVLEALEADGWEKLVGMSCRVDADYSKVHRIGHYLKNRWFDPEAAFDKERAGITE